MSNTCSDCIYLEWNNKERYSSTERYWCKENRGYKEPTERACSYDFKRNMSIKKDEGYKPSGCYLTTLICDVLNYDDNCEALTSLRFFRDNYLKPNPNYQVYLRQYDFVGPIICHKLREEENLFSKAKDLYERFIIECVYEVKNGNYEDALQIYLNLTNMLIEEYGIVIPQEFVEGEYNLSVFGKGRFNLENYVGTEYYNVMSQDYNGLNPTRKLCKDC